MVNSIIGFVILLLGFGSVLSELETQISWVCKNKADFVAELQMHGMLIAVELTTQDLHKGHIYS